MEQRETVTFRKILSTVKYLWTKFDKDGNGSLDKNETRALMKQMLYTLTDGKETEFTEHQFNRCFQKFDKDKNGTIEREEMQEFVKDFYGYQGKI